MVIKKNSTKINAVIFIIVYSFAAFYIEFIFFSLPHISNFLYVLAKQDTSSCKRGCIKRRGRKCKRTVHQSLFYSSKSLILSFAKLCSSKYKKLQNLKDLNDHTDRWRFFLLVHPLLGFAPCSYKQCLWSLGASSMTCIPK